MSEKLGIERPPIVKVVREHGVDKLVLETPPLEVLAIMARYKLKPVFTTEEAEQLGTDNLVHDFVAEAEPDEDDEE